MSFFSVSVSVSTSVSVSVSVSVSFPSHRISGTFKVIGECLDGRNKISARKTGSRSTVRLVQNGKKRRIRY